MNDEAVLAGTALRIERLIPAPPERVFALWTDPALLAKWWGPEGYQTPTLALEVRPGGNWSTTMRNAAGALVTVCGAYRKVDPPRLLVLTWSWLDDKGARGHETEITLTFDPVPGGTRLVLRQERFQSKEVCDRHNQGWSSSLERLAAHAG